MWVLEPTSQFLTDAAWYAKKHPRELEAVLNNVKRYQAQLNHCKKAACVQAGYLHSEPKAIRAVDQKGGGKDLQETRLYTLAVDSKKILYMITVGNKKTQQADIKLAGSFADTVKSK